MVGSIALIGWGLYAALYAAIVVRWTMGGYFAFFFAGLLATTLGTILVRYGRGHGRAGPRLVMSAAQESLTALLGFIGLLLLLPGLCSFLVGSFALSSPEDSGITYQGFILAGLLVGASGIALIVWGTIPSGAAGLIMAAGLFLLIPGVYAVFYGISRLYWINHLQSPLIPIGLPAGVIGILFFRAARQRWLAEKCADPAADPPDPAPHS